MTDAQCDQELGERPSLGLLQIEQQLVAVRGQPAARRNEERRSEQRLFGEVEEVPFVEQQPCLQHRGSSLVAETLDVERRPTRQVEQPLPKLGRTGAVIRAAQVRIAFAFIVQLSSACRALGRHHEGPLVTRSKRDNRTHDLRNHIAGLPQHHGVANQYALAR